MSTTSASSTSASNTNVISALGAGSGVDVKALAQGLVDAERTPRKDVIDKKIAKSEARISGYAAVASSLATFKTAFESLNTKTDFSAVSVSSAQTNAFYVTTNSAATTGSHSVTVSALATPQRSISAAYTTTTDAVNSSTAFDITLDGLAFSSVAQTVSISSANATPTGVVNCINAANLGVTAALIETDSGYQIVVNGDTGTDNAFSISGGDLSFTTTAPTDATLTVDGLSLTRSTNQVSDAIPGVTLNFSSVTSSATSVDLVRDTSPVKAAITALVAAYNDVHTVLTEAASKTSKVSGYGASLVGDSTVQSLQSQLRDIIFDTSATASNDIAALRDLGVSVNLKGELTLNTTTLDTVLASNYADAVTMLTADIDTEYVSTSETDADVAGVAGVAINTLTTMLSSTGTLLSQSTNATSKITDYNKELEKLETRMAALLINYTKQFSVMESMVGQSNSLRTSLTGTFDGMMSTYTNN